jgi:hypothetical protein
MARCSVCYIDKVKKPENWPSLLSELRKIGVVPELLYSQEHALKVLEGLCTKCRGAIVLRLNGNLYAMPNIKLKMTTYKSETHENSHKKMKETTLDRVVIKKLDAREHPIVITSRKGFENFSKDLFRGKIRISKPRWIKKLMMLGLGVVIVVLMIHFNVLPSSPSPLTETSILIKLTEKVTAILILYLFARRRGYFK